MAFGGGTYRRGRWYIYPTPTRSIGVCATLLFALFLVTPPIYNFFQEKSVGNKVHGFKSVQGSIMPASNARLVGDVVHLEGASYSGTVTDLAFGVHVDHALQLERRTEYCQWREVAIRHDAKCEESPADEDCVSTTSFHYFKGWLPLRLNSFLFDQPAAHHNPQWDPFPSAVLTSLDAIAQSPLDPRKYKLLPSVLQNARSPLRAVDFGLGASLTWTEKIRAWLGLTAETKRFEDIAGLDAARNSPASKEGFAYVGLGGYFFAPHNNPSMVSWLAKAFFEHLEGTLTDWQFGDLMPSCTAGDIRIRFYVRDPEIISTIGMVMADSRFEGAEERREGGKRASLDARQVAIEAFTTVDHQTEIGFTHGCMRSARAMLHVEAAGAFWQRFFARVLLAPWAFVVSQLAGAFLGLEMRPGRGEPVPTPRTCALAAAFGVWGSVVALTWWWHWGGASLDGLQNGMVYLLVASALAYQFASFSAAQARQRGFRAAWRLVARSLNLPKAWCPEDEMNRLPSSESCEETFAPGVSGAERGWESLQQNRRGRECREESKRRGAGVRVEGRAKEE